MKHSPTPQQIVAADHMANLLHIDPLMTCTQLAEYTAYGLNHDEWLDDLEHWIWELALNAKDTF